MPVRRSSLVVGLAALTTLALGACGGSSGSSASSGSGTAKSSSKQLVDVKVAYPTASLTYAPMLIMQSNPSFCDQYGVHVTSTFLESSTIGNAVESGSVDIIDSSAGQFVLGLASDPGATIGIGTTGPIAFDFWATKHISSVQQLKGGQVSASAKGSTTDLADRAYLEAEGITGYSTVYTGSSASALTMVITGRVNASGYTVPLPSSGVAAGVHSLADLTHDQAVIPFLDLPIIANTKFYKGNPTAVKEFLECFQAGNTYAATHEDQMRTIATTVGKIDPAVFASGYQGSKAGWSLKPYTAADVTTVADHLRKFGLGSTLGSLNAASSVDTSIVSSVAGS